MFWIFKAVDKIHNYTYVTRKYYISEGSRLDKTELPGV